MVRVRIRARVRVRDRVRVRPLGSYRRERGLREEGELQHAAQLRAEGARPPDEGRARRREALIRVRVRVRVRVRAR